MRKHLLNQPMFRVVVPPFYGFMMYFLILLVNNRLYQIFESLITDELMVCVGLAYLVSESIRFSTVLLEKYTGESFKKPLTVGSLFFLNLLVGAGMAFLGVTAYFKGYMGYEYLSSYKPQLTTLVTTFSISSILYTLFYLSIYFLTMKNESQLEQEDLKRQNLEHQLEIFNNEINPDLLFQSLETLISLVHHDKDAAEDFVDQLSLVYRYILDNRKRELVPLREELRIAKTIFYLFKEKYPGQVSLEIDVCGPYDERLLVPNSTPMLLDCIINGSIISKYQPLKIQISCDKDEDYLVIQHNDNDKLSASKYVKESLNGLHEAFAYFTDRPVIQIKAYGDVFIKLPLLDLK
ncbi:MAG: histidine kinase [Roseivirga sp.]|nr:histidine kinase [Roseivirga sp.]